MITAKELWAKLQRDSLGAIVGWHSLVHHSADVAAVVVALLAQPTLAARFAHLAGRDRLDETTCHRLAALAFLHDIGKANRGFRARVDRHAPAVGHIDQLGWLFTHNARRHHTRLVAVLGLDRLDAWFGNDEWSLLEAVFAHHGRPWRREPAANHAQLWAANPAGDPIADLAPMRDALDRRFSAAFRPGPALPAQPAFAHAFAGLLMLADWLGSDSDAAMFPFADGTGPDRMEFARDRAAAALRTVGLESASASTRSRVAAIGFDKAFDVPAARPMQLAAASPKASCVVLEAETGSGKTEAALWRFKRLFEEGAVDGLYFALPTRVAATAMFRRVKLFRDRVFGATPPAVVLAVPGQAAVDEAEGRPLPQFGFEWDDAADGGAGRARWAAEHPKRFLAATIAVGAVDQALLGAVRTRHAHMRGAALMRNLLVVDEVHASDRYMESLLGALLANHLGAGGHALLLSATLGATARSRLLRTACPDAAEAELRPYPALSWAEGGVEHRRGSDGGEAARQKRVQLCAAPLMDRPDEIARLALQAAQGGAKVLVIRNTVAAAVATAAALEVAAGAGSPALFRVAGVATAHHGRFAAEDRRLLDSAVEAALGRGRRGPGCVVAGTQTLEVSLDLDADLLMTDLCPADVLLQRIGRLHRHADSERPPGCTPRVVVLAPESRDLLRFSQRGGAQHGLGRVYDDLAVIEATWREIEARYVWSIPADNRRLVERTTHPAHLGAIAAELMAQDAAAWARHLQGKAGSTAAELNTADMVRLDWSTPFDEFRIDADERAATRLGVRDRQVDLQGRPGPFGSPATTLRVPHFLIEDDLPPDAEPADMRDEAGEIWFRLGGRAFRYGRLGLESGKQRA